MNDWMEQAKAKLEDTSGKFDRYAAAMKGAVKAKLLDFISEGKSI